MSVIAMFALASPSQFTGLEQTRVMDLITVLAFTSLVIWAIILLSMIVRRVVIIVMAIVAKHRIHQKVTQRRIGVNNGS